LDVHQVLRSFAQRNKLSVIDFRVFTAAVQRQAKNYDQANAFYRDLALHPETILVPRLFQLAREKSLSLMSTGNQIDRIYLPEAFTEPVLAEYRRIEENPEIPFPDEDALKISVPGEWIQPVSIETDLPALIDFEGDRPALIYKLTFPEGLKHMLVLAVSVGDKLLEYAVLKLRHYLRKGANKDYIQQRMMGAFGGKEMLLKDTLTTVLIKPFEAIQEMRQGKSDFTYPFWAYLSSAIKKDLSGKGDPTPDDVAAFQSAFIVDVYNNYFKGKTQRQQEREDAFKALGVALRKAPYLFTIQEIIDFRDGQGRPLLGKYTREELEEWIHDETTNAPEGVLPELLVLNTGQGRTQLIAKDRFLQYVVKGLHDARSAIKPHMVREWRGILYDFGTTDAMESDDAFRAELSERLAANSPVLAAALGSGYCPAIYAESRGSKDIPADLDRYFGGGRLAPLDTLLNLERKSLLTDVRMLLPFWYTVPVLSWFIGIFKRSSKRKADQRKAVKKAINGGLEESAKGASPAGQASNRAAEFSQMAKKAERRFLPEGYSADEYLQLLESRWNNILDLRAKANLREDVNSLVRDYLRGILRSMKPAGFTPERVEMMAANLADTSNLLKIRNHAALEEYIRLYMVKLLKR
jgi:hypothetical protein